MTLRPPIITSFTPISRQAALVGTLGTALMLLATVVDNKPIGNRGAQDWPVPKTAQPSVLLKTHIDPLKLPLIGKDTFFAAPGMGPTYDWLNPQRSRVRNEYGFVDPYKVLIFLA